MGSANHASEAGRAIERVYKLAEARLVQLLEEGTVTGIGTARCGSKDVIFVGVSAETNVTAPTYVRSEIEAIRKRLKDALGDVPFEILGDYDAPAAKNAGSDLPTKASMPLAVPLHVPSDANQHQVQESPTAGARREHITTGGAYNGEWERLALLEAKIDSLLEASKGSSLNERLIRLETQINHLPSRGFVITAIAVILALLTPMLVLQPKATSLLTAAVLPKE